MTIVVGVATPEGLVLASDSRATKADETGQYRVASDTVQKVFKVGDFGVACFGNLVLASGTVAALMDQFEIQLDPKPNDADALAKELHSFFDQRFREAGGPEGEEVDVDDIALGFIVCGYDQKAGVGHVHVVLIPEVDGFDPGTVSTVTGGMIWQGQTDVADRLIYGYDRGRLEDSNIALPEEHKELFEGFTYDQPHLLTLQDGIDYACFLIRTTVEMQRFSNGTFGEVGEVPGCGGPTQILAVERSGPAWVSRLGLEAPRRQTAGESEVLS